MVDLRDRAPWLAVPETMDEPSTDAGDLDRALTELRFVHDWLGGDRCARAGLRALLPAAPAAPLHVLDVGSGGGEVAGAASRWARRRGLSGRAILLDFNRRACLWARRRCSSQDIVVQADAFNIPLPPRSVDIVHCGLFLHHFEPARATALLARLLPLCRVGLVVSDLHRHPLPYAVTRWGSRLLSRSAMVRHDAPLSVARGFRRSDLEQLAAAAGFRWTHLRRVWPWRWLAVKRVDHA